MILWCSKCGEDREASTVGPLTPRDWPTFWQSLTPAETAAALRAAPRVAGEWTYGHENWDGWVRARSGAPLRFPLAQVQGDEATGFHWKVDAPEIEAYGSGPTTLHDAQEACDFELRQAGWVLL